MLQILFTSSYSRNSISKETDLGVENRQRYNLIVQKFGNASPSKSLITEETVIGIERIKRQDEKKDNVQLFVTASLTNL